jgi:hypothetical protein
MDLEGLINNLPRDTEAFGPVSDLLKDIRVLDEKRPENLSKIVPSVVKLKTMVDSEPSPVSRYGNLRQWLILYEKDLAEAGAWLQDTFGPELEVALKDVGLPLSGHYPELKAGLFTVALDFSTYRVTLWYGPKQERLGQCPMWPSTVADKLAKLGETLGGPVTAESFRIDLQQAYMGLTEGKLSGSVPIIEVLEALWSVQAGHFSQTGPAERKSASTKRADFSYNLFRFAGALIAAGLQLRVASLAHTRRRGDFLWVPDSESGRGCVYSHVVWRGVG